MRSLVSRIEPEMVLDGYAWIIAREERAARQIAVESLELTAVAAFWSISQLGQFVNTLGMLAVYAHHCRRMTGRPKRMEPTALEAFVASWKEAIITLAVAHSPEERTRADERSEDLLRPLFTLPIAQVREWARSLAKALREDARTPFLVWSSFERVVEPMIRVGPDKRPLELRHELAADVAAMAAEQVQRADWIKAIAGALQWRDAGTLTAVKTALESGAKPKLRGRESCLFLELETEPGQTVMVVL
jgi:hypothetical protein